MIRFVQLGRWQPGQITVGWTSSSRLIIPEVESLIERTWANAQRPGVHLFDGPMCRLENVEPRGDSLHLALSRTSYKPFWGTNLHNAHLAEKYGPQILANPVGVSSILLSSDKVLIMGRRNQKVAYYPGYVHPIAGCLEPQEKLDVFEEVRRELREEASLGEGDISEIFCAGMVENISIRQPELIFMVRSRRSRTEIESQLDPAEHQSLWAVAATQNAVEQALNSDERFTPIAVAALTIARDLPLAPSGLSLPP